MIAIDLKSLGVTKTQFWALLKTERRKAVRKRLVAFRELLKGQSAAEAAMAAKVDPSSVTQWIRITQLHGLNALMRDERRRRLPRAPMTNEAIQAARDEIHRALKRMPEWRLRLRLQAIDLALAGRLEEAAALAHVKTSTVQQWLDAIRRDGIENALARWEQRARPRKLHADADMLLDAALSERNPRIRKRLLALACAAEGMSVDAASAKASLDRASVYMWLQRFQETGTVAICSQSQAPTPALPH